LVTTMQPKFTKGGRGKVAPYQTTHHRIPLKISSYVKLLSDAYKEAVELGQEKEFLDDLEILVNIIHSDKLGNENRLVDLAKQIVNLRNQKKSTRASLDSLLRLVLGPDFLEH